MSNNKQKLLPLPPPPLLIPSPGAAAPMQQQIIGGGDQLFTETMSEERDITSFLGVSPNVGDVPHSTGGEDDRDPRILPGDANNSADGVGNGGVQTLPGGTSLRSNNVAS
ncbi:hypothetical protein Salat_1032300 [Sesamum alatum]|uniref:Uncharacterized protein n=1 Tax=Sesamum alatum TaxID=300844 RepID=A0AAE1YM11_9LAMI|nr:hypothetical protein Salat_1032300 [Sesamum alatum]